MSRNGTTPYVDFKVVKDRVSITKILEHYGLLQNLRKTNDDQLTGCCPIHKGENPTAFRVSISKNCWNCFSSCKSGGNILEFVAKMEDISIREAARLIAEWFDLKEAFQAPDKPTPKKRSRTPAKVNGSKTDEPKPEAEDETITENKPLSFELKHLEIDHPYLAERGLSKETIETFGLGFCTKGVMRNRIVIPIHNGKGQLVAYAGRTPGDPPEGEEKYKLPKGFRKSLEVFNLHRALETDKEQPLYIVEGFFDCMRLWQSGIKRVVCLMGSSLSEAQEDAIIHATHQNSKIILLFDEDEAGRKGRETAAAQLASKLYVHILPLESEGMQPDSLTESEIESFGVEEPGASYGLPKPKFSLGRTVATQSVVNSIPADEVRIALGRHLSGDWGDLEDEDRQANEQALVDGSRLFSVYHSSTGIKFYIITEADRSATTALLPEDY
ncbi:MAG: CHC2 zinc finger domain-containing protein [Coraliomargaritaceae bacterium]